MLKEMGFCSVRQRFSLHIKKKNEYRQRSSLISCQASIIFLKFLYDWSPGVRGRFRSNNQREWAGVTTVLIERSHGMCVLICVNVSFALVIIRQGTGQTSWYHFLSPSLSPVLTSAFALKHPVNTDVNRSGKNKPIILLAEWKSCTIIKSENEMKDRGLCILKLCVSSVHWRNRWVSEVVMTNHCTNTWQSLSEAQHRTKCDSIRNGDTYLWGVSVLSLYSQVKCVI